jgi:hypothetical protein
MNEEKLCKLIKDHISCMQYSKQKGVVELKNLLNSEDDTGLLKKNLRYVFLFNDPESLLEKYNNDDIILLFLKDWHIFSTFRVDNYQILLDLIMNKKFRQFLEGYFKKQDQKNKKKLLGIFYRIKFDFFFDSDENIKLFLEVNYDCLNNFAINMKIFDYMISQEYEVCPYSNFLIKTAVFKRDRISDAYNIKKLLLLSNCPKDFFVQRALNNSLEEVQCKFPYWIKKNVNKQELESICIDYPGMHPGLKIVSLLGLCALLLPLYATSIKKYLFIKSLWIFISGSFFSVPIVMNQYLKYLDKKINHLRRRKILENIKNILYAAESEDNF